MHVLILYAHPEPASFNGALKDAAVETIRTAGHTVEVSDLYGEGFNPVAGRHDFSSVHDPAFFHYQNEQGHAAAQGGFSAELQREQDRFSRADLVIAQFPLWWGGPPAILKGWFDRAMAFGFAYRDGTRFSTGLFPQKRGLICVTTGGTPQRFSDGDVYGPIDTILMPIQKLCFQYMGMTALPPHVCYGAPRVDAAQRAAYLDQWRTRLREALAD